MTIIVIWLFQNDKERYIREFFSGIGSFLAFSSMLILPILTLGFPMIILMTLRKKRGCMTNILCILQCSLSWGVGYGLTMMTKIFLSMFVLKSNRGWNNVLLYTGEGEFAILDRIKKTREIFFNIFSRSELETDLLFMLCLFLLGYLIIKGQKRNVIKHIIPLLFVGLYPFIWCLVCTGHALHWWTYWNYSITIFAVIQSLWELCDFHSGNIT